MEKESKFLVNNKTLSISYITQFFQYCANALILPYILSNVDSDTMGVWYLFLSISNIALLIDFGFSSSLGRNVSYVFSGAQFLTKEGCEGSNDKNIINYNLLNSVIYTTKKTYLRISLTIATLLITFGSFYIYNTTHDTQTLYTWFFFALSTAFNYYFNYVNIYVKGRGQMNLFNRLIIISKSTYIILILVLLYLGWGLWSLVLANFLSAFLSRQIGLHYFWDKQITEKISEVSEKPTNLFPIIWYNAKRMGITSITNYAYSQANVLFAGFFLSLTQIAQLGLCIQLFAILLTVSRVNFQTYYPKICSLWVSDSKDAIRKIFLRCQMVCYILFFAGIVSIVFMGNDILSILHSNTLLPDKPVLLAFCFFYFMEVTHGNCAILISSRNTIPFYKANIVASITTITLMLVFVNYGLELLSFPLAMCCGSLPYNSWKWVLEAYKLLK